MFFLATSIFYCYEWLYLWHTDERTKVIRYASAYWMFSVLVLCDFLLPKAYMWHVFFLLKYGLVFMVGAFYLVIQKYRDAA
ncbi:hypothetical protein YK48G_08150 [Lentilactobacillus fungorum]|uniref:Integral membrane protein n=1 Tax=Lentilactobacillus fungorum TaxID=2201250 RepID=A0ABQ3VWW5_9LACO|nr:hypothetical protein [Lentilactobacillus fungorum]GHP13390.1 hypothetical protein YK48G_08150 [Lentilactobacillus fungorum]